MIICHSLQADTLGSACSYFMTTIINQTHSLDAEAEELEDRYDKEDKEEPEDRYDKEDKEDKEEPEDRYDKEDKEDKEDASRAES